MKYKIIFSDSASNDLDLIASYLLNQLLTD